MVLITKAWPILPLTSSDRTGKKILNKIGPLSKPGGQKQPLDTGEIAVMIKDRDIY